MFCLKCKCQVKKVGKEFQCKCQSTSNMKTLDKSVWKSMLFIRRK